MAIIIIFAFTLLFMWGSGVLCYRMGAVENGKYLLGITLSKERRKEVEVEAIVADYQRAMRRINQIGLAACVPVLMLNTWFSVAFLALMIWFLLFIYFHNKNVSDCAHRLYRVKQKNGWLSGNPHVVRVDTALSSCKDRGEVSAWWLVPACLAGLGGCLWTGYGGGETMLFWVLPGSLFLAEAFLALAYWGIRRGRSQVYCSDTALNQRIDRAVRYEWSKCMVLHAYEVAVWALYAGWQANGRGTRWGIAPLLLLLCGTGSFFAICRAHENVKRMKEEALFCLSERNGELYGDDDEYWLNGYPAGMRPAGFAEKRIGIGWTTSASLQTDAVGKGVLILTGIFTVAICLYLASFDFAQVEMELGETDCRVSAASMGYRFDLADVEAVTLTAQRPSMSKRNGFDSNRLFLGDFRVQGYGTCKVYLYVKNDYAIRVDTSDKIIWLNGRNEAETRAFYEELKETIKN